MAPKWYRKTMEDCTKKGPHHCDILSLAFSNHKSYMKKHDFKICKNHVRLLISTLEQKNTFKLKS